VPTLIITENRYDICCEGIVICCLDSNSKNENCRVVCEGSVENSSIKELQSYVNVLIYLSFIQAPDKIRRQAEFEVEAIVEEKAESILVEVQGQAES
jgi:hypothetical protein